MPIINGQYFTQSEVDEAKRQIEKEEKVDSFINSAVVGALTGSTIIGGLVGGSFLGGLLGDALEGDEDSLF